MKIELEKVKNGVKLAKNSCQSWANGKSQMKRILLLSSLILCTHFSSRGAISDAFVVLDGTNGFYASPEVPQQAVEAMKKAQKDDCEIRSFAFTPSGDWIALNDKNYAFSDSNMDMCKNIQDNYEHSGAHGKNLNCVAITPSGSWINCYRRGLWGSGGNPLLAWNKYQDLNREGHDVRYLAYGTHESWVICYDKAEFCHSNIPDRLASILDSASNSNITIQCVALSGTNWICLGQNNYWASDANWPAAKIVDEELKAGRHPKWVAFVPNLGQFDARKFGTLIREGMAGKVGGGYECVVIDHGKLVVALAEGWARAPWEKVDPAVKMTVNSHMDVASVSKTITAVAMLKLCEECAGTSRQFSLDEPFWPHIRLIFPNVNEDIKKITIRQVLTHQSGFTNEFGHDPAGLNKLFSMPPSHPPGTFKKYQNINFYIIHLLIEQIGQTDCTTYVKTHVLIPMGITDMDTRYHDKPPMCCYAKPGNQNLGADIYHDDNSSFAGPGGWYASAVDLGQFLEGIRQCRVLSPATTAMMFKENLGWDWGGPSGPSWGKGGLAPGPDDSKIVSGIVYFSDGVETAITANCDVSTLTLPQKAWKDARY